MKPIRASGGLWLVTLLTGCAAQQSAPDPTQLLTAVADDPQTLQVAHDTQTLQEITVNVETVALLPARPPADDDVICVREKTTGSHIATDRCYTREQQRRQNEEAQEWLRSGGQRGSVAEVYTVQ